MSLPNVQTQPITTNMAHPFMIAQLTTIGLCMVFLVVVRLCIIKGAFQTTEYDDGIIVPKLFYSVRAGASEPGKVGDSAVQQPGNNRESSEPSECVLTVEDLSLAVTTSGGETEAKILSEAGEERRPGSSGGEREREDIPAAQ